MPPILTVDAVVFQLADDQLEVLLMQRPADPFKGEWALPGGYNAAGETTMEATARVLLAKTGIDAKQLGLVEQLYTFDTVARDPRGHAVSVSYLGLGRGLTPKPKQQAGNARFFPLTHLPALAFDHQAVITYAHERLVSKVDYTNAVFALLPETFTLSQLQKAYEAIYLRKLDKRNFRKKFLAYQLIHPTDEYLQDGAHRPARLYKFNKRSLESLQHSFD